jgi:hypothetical protein
MKTIDDARFAAFGLVGNALFRLQRLEDLICRCWLNFSKTTEVDGEIYQEFDCPRELYLLKKKRTLGVLVSDVKSTGMFKRVFEKRFERYLRDRNRLVHRIFTEAQFSAFDRVRSIGALQRFVIRFIDETDYFMGVFDAYLGLHLAIEMEGGRLKSDRASADELARSLKRLLGTKDSLRKKEVLRGVYKKIRRAKKANKALEPTPTSVTDRAAHAPRQP